MPPKLNLSPIVNHLRKPIRCLSRGMTTADMPPTNPHAFRLWCAGVPKEQAEDYAEYIKARSEIGEHNAR